MLWPYGKLSVWGFERGLSPGALVVLNRSGDLDVAELFLVRPESGRAIAD